MAFRGLNISSFWLKVIAIVGMTANHVAHVFVQFMPYPITFVLYSLGGLTFPIMAYLIMQGYLHTSNVRKYALRLGIFAVVSQVPFSLLFGYTGNVFFTLLIGLLIVWAYDKLRSKPLFALVLIVGVAISYFCDWSLQGPLIIFFFFLFRKKGRAGVALTMLLPYLFSLVPIGLELPQEVMSGLTIGANAASADFADLGETLKGIIGVLDINGIPLAVSSKAYGLLCSGGYAVIGFTIAMAFIMGYNGRRGRPLKWFFYIYYPVHLLVIWAIDMLMTGNWPTLL